jgi:2-polyprenyl-3-methyl-5-hydroxy-6-metoxy-1,4-benzoquinol methylase
MNFDVKKYWDNRYKGRPAGSGFSSHDPFWVKFKTETVNKFIVDNGVSTVLDMGCGDGNILDKFNGYENYCGIDVSDVTISNVAKKYKRSNREFFTYDNIPDKKFDLVLSLDVLYHIVNISDFNNYLDIAADKCNQYFVVLSTNKVEPCPRHIEHREFIPHVEKRGFVLLDNFPKDNDLQFYIFEKEK